MAQQPRAHTALAEAQSSVPMLGSSQLLTKASGEPVFSSGICNHLQSNVHTYTDIYTYIIKR